jgi:hypothetical protein
VPHSQGLAEKPAAHPIDRPHSNRPNECAAQIATIPPSLAPKFGTETPRLAPLRADAANLARSPQHAPELAGKLLAMVCDAIVRRKSICLPA